MLFTLYSTGGPELLMWTMWTLANLGRILHVDHRKALSRLDQQNAVRRARSIYQGLASDHCWYTIKHSTSLLLSCKAS